MPGLDPGNPSARLIQLGWTKTDVSALPLAATAFVHASSSTYGKQSKYYEYELTHVSSPSVWADGYLLARSISSTAA